MSRSNAMHCALVASTGVLICAASAAALPYQVRSADTNALGSPLVITGDLFQSVFGSSLPPNPDAIEQVPSLEFDSYIAIDIGPSRAGAPDVPGDGFWANGPGRTIALIGNPFQAAGSSSSLWYVQPGGQEPRIESAPNALFDGREAVFLGRFTFRSSTGAPIGSVELGPTGMVVDIRDPGNPAEPPPAGGSQDRFVRFTAFDQPVQEGFDEVLAGPFTLAQPYVLSVHQHSATLPPHEYLINDIYIVEASTSPPPPPCAGDANGDNQVNGADLSVLLSQFGQSVTPGVGADFSNDGLVNGADLSVLLSNFGAVCGP